MSGSWLLMQDLRSNFYIMNLFTRERIDMPSLESQLGNINIEVTKNNDVKVLIPDRDVCITYIYENHNNNKYIRLLYFWIDEKTKDYVVVWTFGYDSLFYTRKGEICWKQLKYDKLIDMVYKDHKLYLYSFNRNVEVFDISGDFPRQVIYDNKLPNWERDFSDAVMFKSCNLVVTVTGEILKVRNKLLTDDDDDDDDWSFSIHKLDSSTNKWEKLTSLGDEAILLDLGITVHANSIEGVNRNSIYYSGLHHKYTGLIGYVWSKKDIFIFNLDTHKVERLDPFIYSGIQVCDARWFVINMKQK